MNRGLWDVHLVFAHLPQTRRLSRKISVVVSGGDKRTDRD